MLLRFHSTLTRTASLLAALVLVACVANPAPAQLQWNNVTKSETFPDLAWKFDDGLQAKQISRFSPPALDGGLVYLVADPDHRVWEQSGSTPGPYVVAVDEATGQAKWKTEMDGIGLVDAAPIVQNGVVLARTLGNMDPNDNILAFDAQTGAALWKLENTFPAARTWKKDAFCTLVLKDNKAGASLQELDDVCVDWRSGAVVSQFTITEKDGWSVGAAGVAANGNSLFMLHDFRLSGFKLPSGTPLFQAPAPDGAYKIAAAGGLVYANDDYVSAYDAQTGAKSWRLSQKVGNAEFMLTADDNTLYISPETSLPPELLAVDGKTGALKWSLLPGAEVGRPYPPQISGNLVYAAFGDGAQLQSKYLPADGQQGAKFLYALDRQSGAVKWRYEQPDFKTELYNTSRITLPVAELNGSLYVTTWLSLGNVDYSSLHSSTLFRLDAATGKVISTTTLMLKQVSGSYSHIGDLLTGAYALNNRVYLPTGANSA